jgi:hypothetical protein
MKKIFILALLCIFYNCVTAQNTKINMRGFKCFEETDEAGEDEMYFVIQVYSKGVLVKTTRFPETGTEFPGIDKGEATVFADGRGNIYDGPIEDVQIVIYATESDKGSIADAFKSIIDFGASNLPTELFKYASPAYLASELKKIGNPIGGIYTSQYNRAIPLASQMTNGISNSLKNFAGKFYSPGDEPLESRVVVLNKTALLNDKMRIKNELGNTRYNFDSDYIRGDGGTYKVYFDYVTIPPPPTPVQATVVPNAVSAEIMAPMDGEAAQQLVQNNVLFYNDQSGAATMTKGTDFSSINNLRFGTWTHIVPIINNDILFYNTNSAANTITDNATFSTSKFINFSTGWTSIIKLDDKRMLFHNKTTGVALVTNNTDFNTIQTLDFSPYTHIANVIPGKIIAYNSTNGKCAIANIIDFGATATSNTILKNCTSIKYVGSNKILFYNSATGEGNAYNIGDLSFIKSHPFAAGWTSIEKIGINKILFYNANTGAGTLANNIDFNTISTPPLSGGWSHIVEIK